LDDRDEAPAQRWRTDESQTMNERIQAVTEVSRELQVRGYVYPKLVATGKLTQQEADRRMHALRCALYFLQPPTADTVIPTPTVSGK